MSTGNDEQKCANFWCDNERVGGIAGAYCTPCQDFEENKINAMQGIVEGAIEAAYVYICETCGGGQPKIAALDPGQGQPILDECPECGSSSVIMQEIDESAQRAIHEALRDGEAGSDEH